MDLSKGLGHDPLAQDRRATPGFVSRDRNWPCAFPLLRDHQIPRQMVSNSLSAADSDAWGPAGGEHTAPTIGPPRGPAAPVSPAGMSAPASGGTALHRITHASVTLEGKAGGPPRGLDLLASTAGRSRNSRSLANDGGSKPTIASRPGTHPAAGSPCDHNATHAIASPVTGGGMPSLYRPWPRKVLRRASRAFRAPGGEQKSCHPRQDAWFSSTPEATRPVGQVLAPPRKHRAVALARRHKLGDPQAPSGCTVGARAHPSSCQSGTPGDRR